MLLTPESFLSKTSIKKYYGQKLANNYPEKLIAFEQTILTKNIQKILTIWDYLSIDLVRNHIQTLEIVSIPLDGKHTDWLRENIKLESFLNMISTHHTKTGCIEIGTFLRDTFDQLGKLLNKKVEVAPPKRWRLIEFHDQISYLYLKNNTKNNKIKTLIKPYKKDVYLVSQPKESIEIIIWGKKVKNCVASYEERIGDNIWIFFIEKDGVPLYTVETDKGKTLNVKQMVSQCNGRVTNEEREFARQLINSAVKNSKV